MKEGYINNANEARDKNFPYEIISGLKRVGNNFIDSVRKITYPLAFLGSFLSYEMAHGVEIPSKATYSEGLQILSEATQSEDFETGAVYIQSSEGGVWYSMKGEESNVNPLENSVIVKRILSEAKIDGQDEYRVFIMHNHPTSNGGGMPPSGFGYMGAFSDTGQIVYKGRNKFWQDFASKEKYEIKLIHQVVDAQGVWTFSLASDMSNSEYYEEFIRGGEIAKRLFEKEFVDETERTRLLKDLDDLKKITDVVRGELTELQHEWMRVSETELAKDLINTPLYTDLIRAYKNVGVVVNFKPF